MTNYVVVTTKPWNTRAFYEFSPMLPGKWHLISDKSDFTIENIESLNPTYIFFPHWSWIVPDVFVDRYECVCIHMTDVPYGRGGSPLQNLIIRGHTRTMLTALRMTGEVDAGPVYRKIELLLDGSAQEIFENAAAKTYDLIRYIVDNRPVPQPQSGQVVHFERRRPEQSEFKGEIGPGKLYDLIRMLDAETYPHAFSVIKDYRLEFTEATLANDVVTATVTFRRDLERDE